MASQGVAANSRLAEMQMKFQKKQMLEREQKKLSLSSGDFTQTSKSTIGNGKVRQMFDDRRRGVGIDRSHPLRPIVASTISTTTTARNTNQQPTANKRLIGANVVMRPGLHNSSSIKSTPNRLNNNYSASNGNINVFENSFDESDNIDNETFPKEFSSLSLSNTHVIGSYETNNPDFENNNSKENSRLAGTTIMNKKTGPKTNGIKLNPVITKKFPIATTLEKTTSRTPSSSNRSSVSKTTTNSTKSPPTKAVVTSMAIKINNKGAGNKTFNNKPATFALTVKPPPRISTPPPGMASCQHCQRHFNEDRLDVHEEVCKKMMSKKRKIFDASKHRVKGTEAEKYLKKGKNVTTAISKSLTPALNPSQPAKISSEKKGNWRKKHEEFITAIREAKKVQAHLAKGGKLSDLPPPPPSENPDYVQCPHCSRRFNESAAERHIPKCANMQHNKPKQSKKRF